MMSVSSKILLMGRIYEYLFGETKFSYEKILIFFFTINYTIFAPLNVWYMQFTLHQQFPSATSPLPQYYIQIVLSDLLTFPYELV